MVLIISSSLSWTFLVNPEFFLFIVIFQTGILYPPDTLIVAFDCYFKIH